MSRPLVGTSGWSYPLWRPGFYPTGTKPEGFLAHYATRLPAVELNTTKYRLPSEEQFRSWAMQVPEGFRFAVKAPPAVERRLDTFQERVRALGDRLGCVRIVVERPRDDGLLELLLGSADPAVRYALDLRDPTWDGVEERLSEAGAARVGDTGAGAGWAYLRFRNRAYDEGQLARITAELAGIVARGADVFAFFRHGDLPDAPHAALRVLELGTPARASRARRGDARHGVVTPEEEAS